MAFPTILSNEVASADFVGAKSSLSEVVFVASETTKQLTWKQVGLVSAKGAQPLHDCRPPCKPHPINDWGPSFSLARLNNMRVFEFCVHWAWSRNFWSGGSTPLHFFVFELPIETHKVPFLMGNETGVSVSSSMSPPFSSNLSLLQAGDETIPTFLSAGGWTCSNVELDHHSSGENSTFDSLHVLCHISSVHPTRSTSAKRRSNGLKDTSDTFFILSNVAKMTIRPFTQTTGIIRTIYASKISWRWKHVNLGKKWRKMMDM